MIRTGHVVPKDEVKQHFEAHVRHLDALQHSIPESSGLHHCPYCDEPFDRTDISNPVGWDAISKGYVPGHPKCLLLVKPLNERAHWNQEARRRLRYEKYREQEAAAQAVRERQKLVADIAEAARPFYCNGSCYCPVCDELFLPGPELLEGKVGDDKHANCGLEHELWTVLHFLIEIRSNQPVQKAS